jgi:hypothetical protein
MITLKNFFDLNFDEIDKLMKKIPRMDKEILVPVANMMVMKKSEIFHITRVMQRESFVHRSTVSDTEVDGYILDFRTRSGYSVVGLLYNFKEGLTGVAVGQDKYFGIISDRSQKLRDYVNETLKVG